MAKVIKGLSKFSATPAYMVRCFQPAPCNWHDWMRLVIVDVTVTSVFLLSRLKLWVLCCAGVQLRREGCAACQQGNLDSRHEIVSNDAFKSLQLC